MLQLNSIERLLEMNFNLQFPGMEDFSNEISNIQAVEQQMIDIIKPVILHEKSVCNCKNKPYNLQNQKVSKGPSVVLYKNCLGWHKIIENT